MGVETFYETKSDRVEENPLVDIIAVHGLHEITQETWTDPTSGISWLRDLLPTDAPARRVLIFKYPADASILLGEDPANNILQTAHSLVAEVEAIRSLTNTAERPLVFICHGLGGLIVKKALAYSATQVSKKVEHRYSIYISTHAIIFLGTPHSGYTYAAWQHFARPKGRKIHEPQRNLSAIIATFDEILQNITDEFAPIAKQFHIYFFWESVPDRLGQVSDYVVSQDSAAPMVDRTERCGIHATHSRICIFDNEFSPGFRTLKAALRRYSADSHATIKLRWKVARRFLETQRSIEATELVGFDVHEDNKPYTYLSSPRSERMENKIKNKYYHVPHNVTSIFTGWDSVTQELQQSILAPHGPESPPQRRVFVLYGLGGSGKTQFCLKFVHDNRESFWAIFWLDASKNENAERELSQIGRIGGLGDTHQAGLYWLTGLAMPWLLILDNADDPATDYSKFFPDGNQGHIILTSRLQACKVHATVGSHEFREMNEDDALMLLLRAAGYDSSASVDDRSTARSIAKALGNLPLALTQAGASIRQNICSLQEYLDLYQAHKSDMMKDRSVQGTDQYEYTVYTTWEVSVQRIQNTGTIVAIDAVEILQIMSFLHFEQVPLDMFQKAWSNVHTTYEISKHSDKSTFDTLVSLFWRTQSRFSQTYSTTAEHFPHIVLHNGATWDILRLRRALGFLSGHSLIYKDVGKETYSMHPMVHLWSRERLVGEEHKVWSDKAMNTIAASLAPQANASTRLYRRSIIPHLDACLQQQHPSASFRQHKDEQYLKKAMTFATLYFENGEWRKAESLQKEVIEIRTKTLGLKHPDTLDTMSALADGYWNLFRMREALMLYTKIVTFSEQAYGNEDMRTLKAMDNLASTLWLCGKRAESQTWSEKAVSGMTTHLGPGHPYTLTATLNLARTYMHRGRAAEAAPLLQTVLTQRLKLLGPTHPETLTAYAELGITQHALRNLDEAETLLTRVVHERRRLLGKEHAYTLWAINDLSKIYTDAGRPREAERLLTDILPTAIRTLGPEHIGTSMTRYNLARSYNTREQWSQGQQVLTELIDIQERTLPPSHPDRLIARLELARAVKHLGDVRLAEDMLEALIKEMDRNLGHDHPQTKRAVGQLGAIYIGDGRLDEAEGMDRRLRDGGRGDRVA